MDKTERTMEKNASSDALTAAQLLSIERERILLGSLKLIVAVKLGVEKIITEARRNLVNLFIRYNRYVDRAAEACEISVCILLNIRSILSRRSFTIPIPVCLSEL